jgi:hypothetical protein
MQARVSRRRSAAERRKDDREDSSVAIAFVQDVPLMLAHDCLLYEGARAGEQPRGRAGSVPGRQASDEPQ